MPRFEVRFYETGGGQSPVEEFLDDLRKRDPKAHAKCRAYFDALEEHGVGLDSHYVEKLKSVDDVWELRPEWRNVEYRFLFGVFGRMYVMVWAGIEKGRLRDRDIQLAQKRVQEVARELGK